LHKTSVAEEIQLRVVQANASGKPAIILIHGLWLLSSSWDRWVKYFDDQGFVAIAANWPDDPADVQAAAAEPNLLAGKTIGQAVQHHEEIIRYLDKRPFLIGHSFGGLIAQILAGRGLANATVAIDPAGFRGVLPLPFSALKSAWPVLGNPANRKRAVPLTLEQFRYAFANAVSEDEAIALYREFAVPAPGSPLFQAAAANINPWTEDQVDTTNTARGPLLVVSGERDHTVPHAVAYAAFERQRRNAGITEFVEMPNRGHSLTIDAGWRGVAEVAHNFIDRFSPNNASR
jgi:non-heme chloroperoxidase